MPVLVELVFEINAGYELSLAGTAAYTNGFTATKQIRVGRRWEKNAGWSVLWDNPDLGFTVLGPKWQVEAAGNFQVYLQPKFTAYAYSVAGAWADLKPQAELQAALQLNPYHFELGLYAWLTSTVGLDLRGWDDSWGDLPSHTFELIPRSLLWEHSSRTEAPPQIASQPQPKAVSVGDTATFTVQAGGAAPLSYRWQRNGLNLTEGGRITGTRSSTLRIANAQTGDAGNYRVVVSNPNGSATSQSAALTILSVPATAGMALIPAGSFTMGDTFGEGWSDELPLHTVFVSAFYMDKYEVTIALWDEVYQWAVTHGYSFDSAGFGKAANHPVQTINWYDAVKWCNARSEMEGRTPTYYTSAAQTTVYRSGQVNVQNDWVKWMASGYRLPTEAEWEKAARGGVSGHRFPWGNTITHSQANYYSDPSYAYDTSSTRGFHPTFATGDWPYTSPVGYFAANGYGLYDMAGNVQEWCWDWYQDNWYSLTAASQNDTRGPSGTLHNRATRGGTWLDSADSSRSAFRFFFWPPGDSSDGFGFRCVRGVSSGTTDTIGPALAITSPVNGSVLSTSPVIVTGAASDSGRGDSGITSVIVNGVRADNDTALLGGTANWSRAVSLSPGANTISVVATDGADNTTSASINVTYNPPTPSGMALIPAGNFTMGDTFTEGDTDELPLHTVHVSAFYMDKYEVTKALWDEVYQWAINRPVEVRYSFEYGAQGKAINHPAHTMTWYDAVKWCNARSEKEGRTPAYYTSAAQTTVYRSGQVNVQNDWVKWDRGYRLPTEAEWEKAARGGSSGHRFPWSDADTISHSRANYYANPTGYAYDVNPTAGYHPTFFTGSTPYTSSVGFYAANGYGLYDMAGNVWEWCWDWFDYYSSSMQTDPRGPPSGAYRVTRGGSWYNNAFGCRSANRNNLWPGNRPGNLGFRCALPSAQ